MLICPECKFENPDNHKFCQNCGMSLNQRVCPECGVNVATNAEKCHACGAVCGTVWTALIVKNNSLSPQELGEDSQKLEITEVKESSSAPSPLMVDSYLDCQQRYQLLEPLPNMEESSSHREVCVRVLDCQPYQITPLEAMLGGASPDLPKSGEGVGNIPPLAQTYIALKSQTHKGIPPIHDGWQQDGMQVVLLEDRSQWQSLLQLLQDNSTTSLQILECFYQMTQLWELLAPFDACSSLLELSNLRLDEDQSLALQRLYVGNAHLPSNISPETSNTDEPRQPLTIKVLGQVWHHLFSKSQRTQFGSMLHLLADLEQDKIETLADLQSRLAEIANELEDNFPESGYNNENNRDSLLSNESGDNGGEVTVAGTTLQSDALEETTAIGDELPTVALPMQLSSLDDAGCTDVGKQRNHNEDCFGIETQISKVELPRSKTLTVRGLYILCDGMGGHAGGEVASELAVNTLREYFQTHWTEKQLPSEEVIRQGVMAANQAIFNMNQSDARSGVGRMGTTLVMLLIQDNKVVVAHVGDSRLYRLTRKKGLEQVTVDHEVGQREIARGVEPSIAYGRPDAYQLTQALGPRDQNSLNPDVEFSEINEDTLFVLVSDGLSDNNLLETHWETHLLPLLSSGFNLDSGVKELIDLANQYNGHDNITAVLIRAKVRPILENPD
ncbi:MAG: serine/threonine phosphatase [Calothrix sp. MO_192.B10]|nr:serine/threonine phosphatase [Calothrix sp. MO_192.B10]